MRVSNGVNMEGNRLNLLLSQERIASIVRNLADQISKDYNGKELVLVCILKGAFMFLSDLVRHLKVPVKTGQAHRGRSADLTALSMSNGLPGHASGGQNVSKGSFIHIVPLDLAYPALAGWSTFRPKG